METHREDLGAMPIPLRTYEFSDAVTDLAWLPCGTAFSVVDTAGSLTVCRATLEEAEGEDVVVGSVVTRTNDECTSLAWSGDGKLVVVGTSGGDVVVQSVSL